MLVFNTYFIIYYIKQYYLFIYFYKKKDFDLDINYFKDNIDLKDNILNKEFFFKELKYII